MKKTFSFIQILIVILLVSCQAGKGTTPTPSQGISPQGTTGITPTPTESQESSEPGMDCQELPETTPLPGQSQELTEQAITNLTAFTKLYGYVRYFHPSDQAAEADWEQVALQGVVLMMDIGTAEELAAALQNIFTPLAPTLQVFLAGEEPETSETLWPAIDTANLKVVMWEHRGLGADTQTNSPFKSERLKEPVTNGSLPEGFIDPREPYYAELGGGVAVKVPLAVFADQDGTLPHAVDAQEAPGAEQTLTPRQACQMAGIVIAWNAFQHFYPYFDVVETDWAQVLLDSLSEAYRISSDVEYYRLTMRFVAALQDGHGRVYSSLFDYYYIPPVTLDYVEGQVAVTNVFEEAEGLIHPGDVVLEVDAIPIEDHIAMMIPQISSATVQRERFFWLMGAQGSEVSLDIQTPAGEQNSITLSRNYLYSDLSESSSSVTKELEHGIYYVNLVRITDEQYISTVPYLQAADGIIFDLRGYPNVSPFIFSFLIDETIQSPQWNMPIYYYPDQQNVTFEISNWEIEPSEPRLTDNVVFITNGRAISYAETFMGIVEYNRIGEIIGQTTAGTNGNVDKITLPGDLVAIRWTSLKVLKQDGSQHHGIGILPTVPVELTLQGLAEGRDEYLEVALEIVRQNK